MSGIDQLPENVDPGKREEFLTDAEFLEVRSSSSVNIKLLDNKSLTVVSYVVKDKPIMFQSLLKLLHITQVLGMDREAWSALPAWKQIAAKRAKNLF